MRGPTKDHDEIRKWAKKHGATPAEVKPLVFDSEPTLLRFLFGNDAGTPEIAPIAWEDFFAKFDLLDLSLVYDDSPRFEIVRVEKSSRDGAGSVSEATS